MITQARLKEVLYYHPESGDFVWIKCSPKHKRFEGTQAGTVNTWGYLQIRIDGRAYLAARLAFLYMTGEIPPPEVEVDHDNRIRTDNAWKNLKRTTPTGNQHNRSIGKNNTTGVIGLSYNPKKPSCWQTFIRMPDKTVRQSYHKTKEAAVARLEADRAARIKMTKAMGLADA